MAKKLFLGLLSFLPGFLFAQATFSDSKSARIVEKECDGTIFTVVQELPSLKMSKENFEDTLSTALRSNGFPMTNGEVIYKFVVTTQSQLLGLTTDSGRVSKQKMLKETVLHYATVWAPAKQSGHVVCAYVRLKLKFANDKLTIDIFQ